MVRYDACHMCRHHLSLSLEDVTKGLFKEEWEETRMPPI